MRTRQLETKSPLIRATSAERLEVGLGAGLRQLAAEPATGGLLARQFEMAGATSSAIADEQRETFREAERGRLARQRELERDLIYETDQVRIEALNSQLNAIIGERESQRDEIFRSAVEDGRLLEPEAIQERYGIEADRLMSPREAELIVQGRREQEIRNAIVDAGPRGVVPGLLRFGASMTSVATDPVELASMFIPVVGPARSAAMVARFGQVGGRAAIGATEGAVGSLLTEPLYFGLSQAQQLDYSMQDALFNVGAGLFLGGGIGTVAGIFARRGLSYGDVADAVRPETQVISGDPIELPTPPSAARMGEDAEVLTADAAARQRFREETYGFMGGRQSFEQAIRMMANDASVNVELTMPRAVPRPQTLSEFVRERGGINSADPAFSAQLDQLRVAGIEPEEITRLAQEGGIASPASASTLDQMAVLAQRQGFETPDGAALIAAMRSEAEGSFVFRSRDQRKADQWRRYHQAENDIQAELLRRQSIRDELEAIGYRDATEDEIGLLSAEMARGRSLDDAAKTVGIQAEGLRAAALARQMQNPTNDPLSDFDASMRADRTPEDFDFDAAMVREQEVLRQMEVDGTLTAEQRAVLDEIRSIDERADTYIEAVQAAAVCVMRT
jgi:hypothetical protein